MGIVRREPFRIFFPFAALLAWLGVLPWIAFGLGWIHAWLAPYHALTMTEGFVVAVAAGFLFTMIPRRTATEPPSRTEIAVVLLALLVIPLGTFVDSLVLAESAYLVVLSTLAQFTVRRFWRSSGPTSIPSSFVFLPVGLIAGVAGAGLLIASVHGAPFWTLGLGRVLVQGGPLLAFVLALAPLLTPIICHGGALEEPAPTRWRRRVLHAIAGLVFLTSFALQCTVSVQAGLLLRAAVVAAEVVVAGQIQRWPTLPGLHRNLYRLSLLFVPLGLVAAALSPTARTSMLHLTFIGGISLLVFAVSAHVTFIHTDRPELARRRPLPLVAIGVVTLVAAALRVNAERFAGRYVPVVAVAAALWLAGATIWAVYLSTLIVSRRAPARE